MNSKIELVFNPNDDDDDDDYYDVTVEEFFEILRGPITERQRHQQELTQFKQSIDNKFESPWEKAYREKTICRIKELDNYYSESPTPFHDHTIYFDELEKEIAELQNVKYLSVWITYNFLGLVIRCGISENTRKTLEKFYPQDNERYMIIKYINNSAHKNVKIYKQELRRILHNNTKHFN